ncbi:MULTISPECIES: DMT family transporter [Butyricimonas]|uniref:DMT family transporter n=1 Tax=Butyricimonas hominis TaxID=2763032 RepID=A0ABR7CZT1_9BACT|nr:MULTISPECIES: DMT family transporter [Butyricimonas]MBC5621172.1 DMT family transporter [Butyricimonas hominis]MCB6972013.1 DMT family transporter [Butyricimonas synergistica]MCG4519021.1 DMT family transporter [Butyricimonas sp. DFI.6.44]
METTGKPKEIIGHLMVLSTIIIYSFNTNFMKILMPSWIGPHGLVLLRCTMMAAGFWLISLFLPTKGQAKPTKKDILMMMLGGVLGIGGNLLLYINGLNMTGPVDAFVIRTTQPIIVIGLAVLLLHASFNWYKAIGIILGLAGTVYVSITPHAGAVKDSVTGDVLIFVSSVFNALYLILIKPYTQKFNSVIVMRWMSLAAMIITFPFGIHQVLNAPIFTSVAPTHIWLELGFTLVFSTMLAYFLSLKALVYITPFVESAYIYLLPITGAIVSIAIGLQKFSWHDPIALVLIVIGFILINKKTKKQVKELRVQS